MKTLKDLLRNKYLKKLRHEQDRLDEQKKDEEVFFYIY